MLRSDAALEREVIEELACDAACKLAKIAVDVKNGVVTLTGVVSDSDLQRAALRAVKRVFGVEAVAAHFEAAAASAARPAAAAAFDGA